MSRNCRVVRQNDQMCCSTCGRYWDVGDEDVPECPSRPMDLTKTWAPNAPYKIVTDDKTPVVEPKESHDAAMREIENLLNNGE